MSSLQDKIGALRCQGAPIPLSVEEADAQALRLRTRGLSYAAIAEVMYLYHGRHLTGASWGDRCRAAGAKKYPRGRSFKAQS